jgi:hypothetical protein
VLAAVLCAVSAPSVSRADDSVVQPTRPADAAEATADPTVPAPASGNPQATESAPAREVSLAARFEAPRASAPKNSDAERPPRVDRSSDRDAYPYLLGAGYLVLPAFVAALALAEPDMQGETVFLGAFAAFLVPPVIHMAHGNLARTGYTLLAWPALTLGGAVLGGVIGVLVGRHEDEESDVPGFTSAVTGAVIGGVMGALAWPVIDIAEVVADAPARRADRRVGERAALRVGVAPDLRGGAMGVIQGGFDGL